MKKKQQPSTRWVPAFGRDRSSTLVAKQVQPTKEKAKLDFSWVSAFSLSITVFAAVLFGAGKAYRQAYLSAFGFDDVMMPWPFQDLVYLGITKQLPILLAAPVVAIGAILGLMLAVAVTIWVFNRITAHRWKPSGTIADKNAANQRISDNTILDLTQFVVNCLGAVLLFSVLALFFVARAEKLGKADAKKDLAAIASRNVPNSAKPQLSYAIIERMVEKRRITEEGYVVTCSDHACGLFMPGKGSEASRLVMLEHLVSFKYVQ